MSLKVDEYFFSFLVFKDCGNIFWKKIHSYIDMINIPVYIYFEF